MVRCIPFPVVFLETLSMLLVLVASESILFLVGSLGHWVLGQLCGPKNVSLGIVGLFVQRTLFGVAGTLLEGDSFPIWGLLCSVLWLSVTSHVPLLLTVT